MVDSVRYLVICDGGNVRSYSLATVLKLDHDKEAIAIGRLYTSPDTMEMLCAWAGRIAIVQPHMIESVPIEHRDKVVCLDYGPDRWGIPMSPELWDVARAYAQWLIEPPVVVS